MEACPVHTALVALKNILDHSITTAKEIRVHGALHNRSPSKMRVACGPTTVAIEPIAIHLRADPLPYPLAHAQGMLEQSRTPAIRARPMVK